MCCISITDVNEFLSQKTKQIVSMACRSITYSAHIYLAVVFSRTIE